MFGEKRILYYSIKTSYWRLPVGGTSGMAAFSTAPNHSHFPRCHIHSNKLMTHLDIGNHRRLIQGARPSIPESLPESRASANKSGLPTGGTAHATLHQRLHLLCGTCGYPWGPPVYKLIVGIPLRCERSAVWNYDLPPIPPAVRTPHPSSDHTLPLPVPVLGRGTHCLGLPWLQISFPGVNLGPWQHLTLLHCNP